MWGGEGSCGEKPTCCCYFKCCFKLTLYKDSFGKVVVGGGGGGELRRKEVDWRQLYNPGAKAERGRGGGGALQASPSFRAICYIQPLRVL